MNQESYASYSQSDIMPEQSWLNRVVCKNYRIVGEISRKPFSQVFVAIHIAKQEYYAVKIIYLGRELLHAQQARKEAEVLYKLKGELSPKMNYFIQEQDHSFIVQTLLGKNLQENLDECHGTFSMKTVLLFLDRALDALRILHSKEYLHRDVCPASFAIGLEDKEIYMIDFYWSIKYMENNQHQIQSKADKVIGSYRFCSINAHRKLSQNRACDLESLAYVAIFFLKGSLPWTSTPKEFMKEIKENIKLEELCKDTPNCFLEYVQYVKSLQWAEQPDYDYCKGLFRKYFMSKGFPDDRNYDWVRFQELGSQKHPPQEKKAQMFLQVQGKSFTADVSLEEQPKHKAQQRAQSQFRIQAQPLITDLDDDVQEFSQGHSLADKIRFLTRNIHSKKI